MSARFLTGRRARGEVVWYTHVEGEIYKVDCVVSRKTEPFSTHQYDYDLTEIQIALSEIYSGHGHSNVIEGKCYQKILDQMKLVLKGPCSLKLTVDGARLRLQVFMYKTVNIKGGSFFFTLFLLRFIEVAAL